MTPTTRTSRSKTVPLTGELDLASAPDLTEQFAAALAVSSDLVIDLHEVTFLDATVISTFIVAQQQALAKGGSLVLLAPNPWLEKVLRVAGVTDDIPVLPRPETHHTDSRRNGARVSAGRARYGSDAGA